MPPKQKSKVVVIPVAVAYHDLLLQLAPLYKKVVGTPVILAAATTSTTWHE